MKTSSAPVLAEGSPGRSWKELVHCRLSQPFADTVTDSECPLHFKCHILPLRVPHTRLPSSSTASSHLFSSHLRPEGGRGGVGVKKGED